MAWPLVQPNREMRQNWHLDAICEHLEGVTRGELTRLVINVPPRHMKSLTTSVFWPAWEWLQDPSVQWLFSSHSAGLATRDAVRTRRLMASAGVREAKPDVPLLERLGYRGLMALLGVSWDFAEDENVKTRYSNDRGGYRISTGIGGGATGEGGDRVVVDDPHKLEEADSEAKREEAVEFVTETVPSRLNSAEAATVVIMQRVHEEDVTGKLLEEGGWTHLCLPMEYEPAHPFIWPDDPRTDPGELLWAERFPAQRVQGLKHALGSYKFAGQYQQLPSPSEGAIFQKDWWQRWDELPAFQRVIESWDMAFKDTDDSDFVVGQVWGRDLENKYLLAQIRARLDFTATLDAVQALAAWAEARYPSESGTRLVEDKANGTAVINTLRRKVSGLIPVEPQGGKVARANAIAPQVEAGNVYLPASAEIPCPTDPKGRWQPTPVEVFIHEHSTFPKGANDDQVDAGSQALTRLRQSSNFTRPRTV